jgi:predicted DNA binding protein
MWYLKFKVEHSDCIYLPLLKKYNLSIEFHPLGHYFDKNYVYTSAIQIIHGDKDDIKKYIWDLKKNSRVVKVEESKVLFTLTKQKSSEETYKTIYNPKLMYIAPAYNSYEGYEFWEIACWERKPLEDLIKSVESAKTTVFFELLRFEEKKNDEAFVVSLFPALSEKQKQAIELAYKEGYYQFPKKTNLDKLAKISKISKQTFQENLKKAEYHLIPLLLRTGHIRYKD